MPPEFNPDKEIDYRAFYAKHVKGMDADGNGHCPFHDDDTPSFGVNFVTGQWICRANAGCGSGNVTTFWAKLRGISNGEAFKELIRQYQDGRRTSEGPATVTPLFPGRAENKKKASAKTAKETPVVPEDLWNRFPPIPDDMMAKLTERRGWTREAVDAVDARLGTWMLTKDGRLIEDRKRNRIAIPVRNAKGELVNIRRYQPFGELLGEWTDKETGKPRKESKIYSWGKNYGSAGLLFVEPNPGKPVVFCEGEPDFICALSHGLNAATQTAHPKEWTEEHIARFDGRDVILAMDADDAGKDFESIARRELAGRARSIRHVEWPAVMMDPDTGERPESKGQDLTDFFVGHGLTAADLYVAAGLSAEGDERAVADPDECLETKSGVAGCGHDAAKDRPVVDHNNFQLDELAEIGWELIGMNNDPPTIFHHGSMGLCQISEDSDLKIVNIVGMKPVDVKYRLARYASWMRARAVRGDVLHDPSQPPDAVCADMLAERTPPVPQLRRVVVHPFFDAKGNLHFRPGYDESSRCYYYQPTPMEIPDVPDSPDEHDVDAARNLLDELIYDFPFVGDADYQHAIAYAILPFVREMIDGSTPLHLFSAPQAGSGKSKLVQILAYIALGRDLEMMPQCRDDDEWRKVITAELESPSPFVCIDNLRWKLDSGVLANALTNPMWSGRILKESRMVHAPITWAWAATGNNPNLSTEMARRTVNIHIDAGMERPGERDPSGFLHPDLAGWLRENRPRLVWACLTLARNWIAKGRPKPEGLPFIGSYESWREVVGGIMTTAGYGHFLGNMKALQESSDSETPMYEQFVLSWWQEYHAEEVGVAELYHVVARDGIPIPLGNGSEISQRTKLGNTVLRGMRDRQYAGFRITKGGRRRNGTQLWKLDDVSGGRFSIDTPGQQTLA